MECIHSNKVGSNPLTGPSQEQEHVAHTYGAGSCLSKGAKGAMAPPLFEVLLLSIYWNGYSKIRPQGNGTPGFENPTEALGPFWQSKPAPSTNYLHLQLCLHYELQ